MVTNLATVYILPLPITLRSHWPKVSQLGPKFFVFMRKLLFFAK